jgi:hypothetical protein
MMIVVRLWLPAMLTRLKLKIWLMWIFTLNVARMPALYFSTKYPQKLAGDELPPAN